MYAIVMNKETGELSALLAAGFEADENFVQVASRNTKEEADKVVNGNTLRDDLPFHSKRPYTVNGRHC